MNEKQMAAAIRFLSMDAVQAANSGHPGMPMGMADVATVLFNRFIKIDPSAPKWADRDRFILSAGHGSMLIYSINHLLGYADMPMEQLRNFRQLGSTTPGHPEYGHTMGIETTTGPLGQGISTSIGMAMAEAMLNARYGDELVDHHTYVIAGDGCLMEGVSHEAIDLAGHLRLGKLIVLWDNNKITIDGSTDLATSTDQKARFAAAGWHVQEVDGHDNEAVAAAIEAAQNDPRPSMIDCKTIIGFGAPNKQGTHKVHGSPLGAEEIAAARAAAGWVHPPFEVPEAIRADWQGIAARGAKARAAWEARIAASDQGAALQKQLMGVDSHAICMALDEYRKQAAAEAPKLATRQASQKVLGVINEVINNTLGGSADLTGSNLTLTDGLSAVTRDNYDGRYVYYGIREHGMAAAMNGVALHGGYVPYGGTFTIFVNYMWAAMRLAALMNQQVLYVLTHDSIGQGEDGPTHQPVETLAALRATPNTLVIRPADLVEMTEAYEIALMNRTGPSAIICSRQGFPAVRRDAAMKSNKGAYVLREAEGGRDITLIATGSEVHIAVAAAEKLAGDGVKAAVVSAPCFELFVEQDQGYIDGVLGDAPRIGIEAALRASWDGLILRPNDGFVGMTGFGASAPGDVLYQHFGITADAIAAAAKSMI